MDMRYMYSLKDISYYLIEELRKEFLVEKVFVFNEVSLMYIYNDCMIFGGVILMIELLEIILNKELGVDYFLEWCELGVINIGGLGFIEIDGWKEVMKK